MSELIEKTKALVAHIEKHEQTVQDLGVLFVSEGITRNDYDDAIAESRLRTSNAIIATYDESCKLGASYYENLIYDTLQQGLMIQGGLKLALDRLQPDIRNLQNQHGPDVGALLEHKLATALEDIHKISLLKNLFSGMGLDLEAEVVIPQLMMDVFSSNVAKEKPLTHQSFERVMSNISSTIAKSLSNIPTTNVSSSTTTAKQPKSKRTK